MKERKNIQKRTRNKREKKKEMVRVSEMKTRYDIHYIHMNEMK